MSGLTAKIYCPLTNNVYKNINTNMRLISCVVYLYTYVYIIRQNVPILVS